MYKVCNTCQESKTVSEFFPKRNSFEGFCKACKNIKHQARKLSIKDGSHIDKTSLQSRSDDFITRSKILHEGVYSYGKVEYLQSNEEVEIFCSKHIGYFWQTPRNHLAGNGCKSCGVKARGASRRLTLDEFVDRSNKLYSGKYDYSDVEYRTSAEKVTVGCSIHGRFSVSAAGHLSGSGCPLCSNAALSLRPASRPDEFAKKAEVVHSGKYDYSKTLYFRAASMVSIHCIKCDLDFMQKPSNHLSGAGCPSCSAEKVMANIASMALTTEKFTAFAIEKHGDLYDYSATVYTKAAEMVTIFCKQHRGYFSQTATSHLRGAGCAECSGVMRLTSGLDGTFVAASLREHGDKYDYRDTLYVNSSTLVTIFCKAHGVHFTQSPVSHMRGTGCPSCAKYGYSTGAAGYIYVLKSGDITKIGITNNEVALRARKVSRSSGKDFQIVTQIKFADGWIPKHVESSLLKNLRDSHEKVKEVFDGYTECFTSVDYDSLIKQLVSKVSEAYTLRQ